MILTDLWNLLLFQPLVNGLILLYQLLGQNLGLAIIALTVILRLLLSPLLLPSLKTAQKMKELQPHLEKLKKKHANDKQALAAAQLALYKEHGANPAAGCLPWIIQIIVLIALYNAFNQILAGKEDMLDQLNKLLYQPLRLSADTVFNTSFFYLNLTKPDLISLPFALNLGFFTLDKIPGIFLIGAAITQFYSSKIMMPQTVAAQKLAKKTPKKEDDMATAMQQQMLYLMPIMTIVIGFSFPSGLVLYWLALSLAMLGQQLLINKQTGVKKHG
ncbi:hypothetical protein A2160_04890 [Candidatus Beckwithbacteria bacterium RBG_13_42_9]|uniref:Membrane insertase YidC/Oxa/ALB C-terminal domain-containing protein n=1 Tax=Candidatus Beckwithbacteria bacterium RBG_13_42_9 TaxID=1797457 RepID=A0A1F5E5T1_9BACT|nr:MAG: hypothetical protein A2160_04890 [Candidatus Beckwithbacteria bacterium RBG_13_42_9]